MIGKYDQDISAGNKIEKKANPYFPFISGLFSVGLSESKKHNAHFQKSQKINFLLEEIYPQKISKMQWYAFC